MDVGVNLIQLAIYLGGFIGFAALNAAYLVWVERKGAARFQKRVGPKETGPFGLLQPPVDGIKLMTKQINIPEGVDKPLFILAPIISMVPAIMCFVTVPYSNSIVARDINIGLLLIFAFASVNILALMLAGWSSKNKYAVMSSARVVSQNIAYEIPMLVIAITIVMISGSLNLREIVDVQAGAFWNWNWLPFNGNFLGPITFILFYICSLAETNRAPFDLGECESELVAGFHTEYGGMGFGLFFMAEYANIVIGASLVTILFLGGWYSPLPESIPFLGASGIWWFFAKMYFLIWTVVWIRWTFPRMTVWGLLNLSWKILIPFSLFNLLASAGLLKFLG